MGQLPKTSRSHSETAPPPVAQCPQLPDNVVERRYQLTLTDLRSVAAPIGLLSERVFHDLVQVVISDAFTDNHLTLRVSGGISIRYEVLKRASRNRIG